MPWKGNHEHAHGRSYVGLDQRCSAPLAGLLSILSLDRRFFHCGSFVPFWLWCGSPGDDGHVSASKSGPFVPSVVLRAGLMSHVPR